MRKRHIDEPAPAPPAPANDQADQTLTVIELAQRWRVCRQSITAMIREGRLQAFRVGKRPYRIKEAEVIRYEQQNLAVAS